MKLDKLKQKIKDNRKTIAAYTVVAVSVTFSVISEYRRREAEELTRDLKIQRERYQNRERTDIHLPDDYLDAIYNKGAVLKIRGKRSGRGTLMQSTTGEFGEYLDEQYENYPN